MRRGRCLIASSLRKELSGDVLFDGVSFKVERRDRLALAGPNGAGKTTLLRALAGEVSLEGGELACEKGTRIALHDQRPPSRERPPAARLRACREPPISPRSRRSCGRSSARWPAATTRRRRCAATRAAQARLEHAGGYDWRDRAASVVRGLGFTDADLDRPLSHVLGRRADARVARARARIAAGPAAARRADEPPRHRVARVARGDAEDARRRGDPRRARPLVPRGGDDRRARARRRHVRPTSRARGTSGGASRRRARSTRRRRRRGRPSSSRGSSASSSGSGTRRRRRRQAQSKLKQIKRIEAVRVQAPDGRRRTLGFEFLKPPRSGRDVLVVEDLALRAGDKELFEGATFALERGEHVALIGPNGSGKTTLLETVLGRRAADRGQAPARARRRARVLLAARGRARRARLGARGGDVGHRAEAPRGPGAARALSLLRLGRAREAGRRALGRRAAAAGAGDRRRLGCELPRSSTSRRTTSTSSRASRSRLRSKPFPAQSCSSRTTGRCSTRSPAGSSRSRRAGSSRTPAAGPTTCERRRPSAPAPPPPKAKAERPKRPAKPKPTALELVEAEVARAETRVAELESKLAADWGDTELVAAHRDARSDLEALLSRWEALFEASGAPAP